MPHHHHSDDGGNTEFVLVIVVLLLIWWMYRSGVLNFSSCGSAKSSKSAFTSGAPARDWGRTARA